MVGCPKVWRSERVLTMFDGFLRDVDPITVRGLQGLNPKGANTTEIITVLNSFAASVKYQAAAINA